MSDQPAVNEDCRHYVMQSITRRPGTAGQGRQPAAEVAAPPAGPERIERCRLGANESLPFACPKGCLFYERRSTSSAGWSLDRPR